MSLINNSVAVLINVHFVRNKGILVDEIRIQFSFIASTNVYISVNTYTKIKCLEDNFDFNYFS